MEQYRLSKFAALVPLPDGRGVALHAAHQSRVFLSPNLFQVLVAFTRARSLSVDQLLEQLMVADADHLSNEQMHQQMRERRLQLEKILRYFMNHSFLVPATINEDTVYQRKFMVEVEANRARPMEVEGVTRYQLTTFLERDDIEKVDYDSLYSLRVVILGGCLSQYSADALVTTGKRQGFDIRVTTSWPNSLDVLARDESDLVVLQLSISWLLGPLWDGAAFGDDLHRAELLKFMKNSITVNVREVRQKISNQLLLVHGFTRPMVSPLGMHDFRHEYCFDRIVFELNEHVRSLMRDDPDVMFVDEERIVANFGKRHLLDHLVAPFSHHGPIDMEIGPQIKPTRQETFGISQPYAVAHLLAQEYLDHYIAWKGMQRIKCIIVDLDDTLWPVTLGENGFDLDNPKFLDALQYGVWAGIHQALRLLKERGVVLATASRNTHDVVMAEWDRLADWCDDNTSHEALPVPLLRKDDFVLHEVNWGQKSASVARILSSLGIADDAALFIDDQPVEREEVRRAHPNIQILGGNLNTVRGYLLTSPRLQLSTLTSESTNRTRMMKAQLAKVAAQKTATSEKEFLTSLGIGIRVARLRPGESLGRVVELMQRTNQFNTTLHRASASEIEQTMRRPDSGLFTLEVSDRFGAYGVVGVCLLSGNEVVSFVMSCRVIGVKPAVPFLCTALVAHGAKTYHGRIVEGPRNQPCRSLFAEAGFSEGPDGTWSLSSLDDLKPVDPEIYEITLAGVDRDGDIDRRFLKFRQAAG